MIKEIIIAILIFIIVLLSTAIKAMLDDENTYIGLRDWWWSF